MRPGKWGRGLRLEGNSGRRSCRPLLRWVIRRTAEALNTTVELPGPRGFPAPSLGGGEEPGWNHPCSWDHPPGPESLRGAELPSLLVFDWFSSVGPSLGLDFPDASHKASLVTQIVAGSRRYCRRLTGFAASYSPGVGCRSGARNLSPAFGSEAWKEAYLGGLRTILGV